MWYRCEIQLPEVAAARLFPNAQHGGRTFRRLVALMAEQDGLNLPPAVLNYADGEPGQGLPPVRFAGYARGVAILGVGEAGAELARSVAPLIHAALTRRARALLPVFERSGQCTVAPSSFPRRYYIAGAVLSPTKSVHRWLTWIDQANEAGGTLFDIPEAKAAIEDRIECALVRQLDALSPPEMQDGRRTNWGLLASEADEFTMARRGNKPFKVTLLSAGRHFVETRMNNTARALRDAGGPGPKGNLPLVGVRALELSIDAELGGVWQVGRLTSSGYGLLVRSQRTSVMSEAA